MEIKSVRARFKALDTTDRAELSRRSSLSLLEWERDHNSKVLNT